MNTSALTKLPDTNENDHPLSDSSVAQRAEDTRSEVESVISNPEFNDVDQEYHLSDKNGIGFGEGHIPGVNYRVNGRVYTFTETGRVYSYSPHAPLKPLFVLSPSVIAAVKKQYDENQAIAKARSSRAEALSYGDEDLKEVFRRHLDFTKGHVRPLTEAGQNFYPVGENNWFIFYLGVVEGQKLVFASDKNDKEGEGFLIDVDTWGYTGDSCELDDLNYHQSTSREGSLETYPLNTTGSIWYSDDCYGEIFRVNGKEYAKLLNGIVIEDHYSFHPDKNNAQVVTDPTILFTIEAQKEEDERIIQARRTLAKEKSGGDPKLEEILNAHICFNGGHVYSRVVEGIEFYSVGQNASHSFSMGVKEGKVYCCAAGEEGWDEEDMPVYGKSIREVQPDDWGYVGHL